jgi:hypothetical protein
MENKICLNCKSSFYGRADKKYCSLECKNNFSNTQNKINSSFIHSINKILKSNNKILKNISNGEVRKKSKKDLLEAGFSFDYFTHEYYNNKGERYVYCYDFGYLLLDGEMCLVVEQKKKSI